MTIFKHAIPSNVLGDSTPIVSTLQTLISHDAISAVYAQTVAGTQGPMIGYIPATSDGQGGISQLSRDYDCTYNPQTPSGFVASLSGTTLTVTFPNTSILWNGGMQTLAAGSISATVTTGLWSLTVGYYWGLTHIALSLTSSLVATGNYVELCEINVNTTSSTATVSNGMVNAKIMNTYCVAGPASQMYSIPISDSSGNYSW